METSYERNSKTGFRFAHRSHIRLLQVFFGICLHVAMFRFMRFLALDRVDLRCLLLSLARATPNLGIRAGRIIEKQNKVLAPQSILLRWFGFSQSSIWDVIQNLYPNLIPAKHSSHVLFSALVLVLLWITPML